MSIARPAGVDSSAHGRLWRQLSSPTALVLSQLAVVSVCLLWSTGAEFAVVGPIARVASICAIATALMSATALIVGPSAWGAQWTDALRRANVLEQWSLPWFDAELSESGRQSVLRAERTRSWRLAVTMLLFALGLPLLVLLHLGLTPTVGRLLAGPDMEAETWESVQPQALVSSLGARFELTGPATDAGLPVRVSDPGRSNSNTSVVRPLERFRIGRHVLVWRASWPSGDIGAVDVRVLNRGDSSVIAESLRLTLNSPVSVGEQATLTLMGGAAESTVGTGPVANVRWTQGESEARMLLHLRAPFLSADFGTGPYVVEPTAYYPATLAEFRVASDGALALNIRPFLVTWCTLLVLMSLWWWSATIVQVSGRDGDRIVSVNGPTSAMRQRALDRHLNVMLTPDQRTEWQALAQRLEWTLPARATSGKGINWLLPALIGVGALGVAPVPAVAVGAGVVLSGMGTAMWQAALVSGLVVAGSGFVVPEPGQWSSPHSTWLFAGLALAVGATLRFIWNMQSTLRRAVVVSGAAVGLVALATALPLVSPDSVFPGWAMVAWSNADGSLQTGALAALSPTPVWIVFAALPFVWVVVAATTARGRSYALMASMAGVVLLGGMFIAAALTGMPVSSLDSLMGAAIALADAGPFNEVSVEAAGHAALRTAIAGIAGLVVLLLLALAFPPAPGAGNRDETDTESAIWSDVGLLLGGAILLQVYCWSALDIDGPVFLGSLIFASIAALRLCLAFVGRQTVWMLLVQGLLISPILLAIVMPSLRLAW